MNNEIFIFPIGSGEFASVHENGSISRPAIGLSASDRWRFIGLDKPTRGGSRLVYTFDDTKRMLATMPRDEFERMTRDLHVRDFDHGTVRIHGGKVGNIYRKHSA